MIPLAQSSADKETVRDSNGTSSADKGTVRDSNGTHEINGMQIDIGHPSGSPGAHEGGGRDGKSGSVVQQSPRQNAINQVAEHIKELKARRDAIVKEELDLLNAHDADFAADLGAEWNNKMEELRGEMALNLNEFVKEMGILRDLQQQK
jgi:hypothetical protein